MIDLRLSKFVRPECLRNPELSQSCGDIPVDNMDAILYSDRWMQTSPNFLEMNLSPVFTTSFSTNTMNVCKGFSKQDDDEVLKLCFVKSIENTVDPSTYIGKNLDPVSRSEVANSSVLNAKQANSDEYIDPRSNIRLPNCNIPTVHASLPRQYSLNMAIEVLNACSPSLPPVAVDAELNPSSFDTADYHYLSPSCTNKSFCNCRNRTMSEVQSFTPFDEIDHYRTRALSADIVLEKSVPCLMHSTDSAGGTTDAGSEKVDVNEHATFTEITSADLSENVPSLESVPSFMREMNEYQLPTICEDSLDMNGMLDEFLNSNESALNVGKNPNNSSVQINNAKVLSKLTPIVSGNDVVDLTELEKNESVPAMVRSASYKRKRNQNNKACRESRKKRKLKQVEAEETALRLENENAKLRKEILELEVQVNEARSRFIQLMSNKITGQT